MPANESPEAAAKNTAAENKPSGPRQSPLGKTPLKVWRDGVARPPEPLYGSLHCSSKPYIVGKALRQMFKGARLPLDWTLPELEEFDSIAAIVEQGCDVLAAPTPWLWQGRIPLGRLTLLAGDETRT